MGDFDGENPDRGEFADMEAALLSLLNNVLISHLEYRYIVSKQVLYSRQAAIYKIVTSKYKQEPQQAMEILRILTTGIHTEEEEEKSVDSDPEKANETNPFLRTGKNPLLQNALMQIIKHLFDFLPPTEIKNCRLVCRQWNFTAEPFLRKSETIYFTPETLQPSTFLEVFKYSLPDLPYKSFVFSSKNEISSWLVSELQEFFEVWGKKIKSLEFKKICLEDVENFDVTSWITVATNLKTLKIDCAPEFAPNSNPTPLAIGWASLNGIQFLSLTECDVLTRFETENPRIAPLEIKLNGVNFISEPESVQISLPSLNHYIDISRAAKIDIRNMKVHVIDMGAQVFNARKVHIESTPIQNWGQAKGKIGSFYMNDLEITERNKLQIRKMHLKSPLVDLPFIPSSIEKVCFTEYAGHFCPCPAIQLPNFTSLHFYNVSSTISQNLLYHFRPCSNLVELVMIARVWYLYWYVKVRKIPPSVKRLRIRNVQIVQDNFRRTLDTLIIEDGNFANFFVRVSNMLSKEELKIKVLVIVALTVNGLSTMELLKFVNKNIKRRFQKIIVGVAWENLDLHHNTPYSESAFSLHVNKKANYYRFEENDFGHSLTREEFNAWRKQDKPSTHNC